MERIELKLRYSEVCAIKHALEKGVARKKDNLFKVEACKRERILKDIVQEEVMINDLEQILVKYKN